MTAHRRIIAYPTPELMADAVAERTLLTLSGLLAEPGRDRVDIAVTGGTDGTAILRAIAGSELLDIVDWSHVHVWWGDERFVAADSPERNAVGAREALLDGLVEAGRMTEAQIHEMPADRRPASAVAAASADENAEALAAAAADYQRELVAELGDRPSLDIAMFGLGPDGHFASLFPDLPQVTMDDPSVLVTGVADSPKLPPLRLTFTVPMIANSERTWICASREKKADAVAVTFLGHADPHAPASFAAARTDLLWLTDRAAASLVC
ncbi:6-phosphogluconolactonase [Bifidobacterium choloepi]|uniref:6-phosphogluconolactonase n=1 Tax=Bifidobacterium choloepi TaxID=2614131 RepID=A0A6I5NKG5_9BIFI|nr:6-phosphogluconolactonase [Bifidobacterium choloepi]NEG69342.1 6-phosphogluconolactonase [Bifidobacterium choloepi]